jgi:hypothetical protein
VIDTPAELERVGQRHQEHAFALGDPALTLGFEPKKWI